MSHPTRGVLTLRRLGGAAFLLAVLSVTACVTLAGLKDEPLDRGNSLPFAADYESVVSAARAAVQEVGLHLAEDYPVNDSTWVIFCGWGYLNEGFVGRVVVQRLSEKQTVVRVIVRPRSRLTMVVGDPPQVIFAALIEKLEGKLHTFAADYEAVVSAAREAVQEVGFALREDYPVNDRRWVILCEKYARLFRVVVQRLGEKQTAVRVVFHPREATDLFEKEDFSQDIFAALTERLEGQPHLFAVDYEAVVSAAREAVQEVGFELRGDYPADDSTWVIVCAKYARFLHVAVQKLGEKQTAVRVIFRRGEGAEVWRMEDYSQDIFAALIEKLEGKLRRPEPSPPALWLKADPVYAPLRD